MSQRILLVFSLFYICLEKNIVLYQTFYSVIHLHIYWSVFIMLCKIRNSTFCSRLFANKRSMVNNAIIHTYFANKKTTTYSSFANKISNNKYNV